MQGMQKYISLKQCSGMKKILFIWFFIGSVYGQSDSIISRVVLFGDAGEINQGQQKLIANAAAMVLPNRTITFFLGDNIYPNGMPVDTNAQAIEREILASQYLPFQVQEVPVYFLAGNHDWDHSKKDGLAKLKAQQQFLEEKVGAQVKLIPKAGSPGPVFLNITDKVVAVVIDSEYWLFPHHQQSSTEREEEWEQFIQTIEAFFQQNKQKTILFLAHHPIRSYSEHALKFSWKQHIFPLTSKWSGFYLPLPVVGSLFPLFRSTLFKSAEDLPHPVYKQFRERIESVAAHNSQVVFVSGHDHGLQYISDGSFRQVVSGSGSKTSSVVKGESLLYSYPKQGYSLIDCTVDGKLFIRFYNYKKGKVELAYETLIF